MEVPIIEAGLPPPPYTVELRHGTAYELMSALRVYELSKKEVKLLEVKPKKLSAQVKGQLEALTRVIPSLLLVKLPYQLNLSRAEALLAWLEQSEAKAVVREIFRLVPAFSEAAIADALEGDFASLRAEAEAEALPYIEQVERITHEELRSLVLAVLTGFYELAIQPHQPGAILQRDVEAKKESGLQGPELVEFATGGIKCPPQVGLKTVVLIPQLAMRPYNLLHSDPGIRFYHYPVADSSITEDPLPTLLRALKALADESRLRILRQLAQGPSTVTGLAEELGLAKSTVHHHLVALRAAGFVNLDDAKGSYQQSRNADELLRQQLGDYLRG